jgi:hypothetical protein
MSPGFRKKEDDAMNLEAFKAAFKTNVEQKLAAHPELRPKVEPMLATVAAATTAAAAWAGAEPIVVGPLAPVLSPLAAGQTLGCCTYFIDGQKFQIPNVTPAQCAMIPGGTFNVGPCQ